MITKIADKISGIIDAGELSNQLIQWIGWNNDKELNQFFRNYYPDLYFHFTEGEGANDSE